MTKRTVHYNKDEFVLIEVGKQVEVYAVDHYNKSYIFPHQRVITSTVLCYNEDTGVFETLNSIYVPIDCPGVY